MHFILSLNFKYLEVARFIRGHCTHRIDKQTSGIVVVAKHPTAATALHESFKMRKVHKEYLAIAVGLPTTPTLATSMQPATENFPLQNHLSLPTPLSKEIKQCGRNVSCNSLMVVLGGDMKIHTPRIFQSTLVSTSHFFALTARRRL